MADTSPAIAPPEDIASAISDTCVDKAALPAGRMLGLGLLAGAYIGFGSLVAVLIGAGAGELPYGLVQIATGIGRLGTSSWTIVQAMFQNGRCIATCDTVVVCRTDGQAKPLRAAMVAELQAKLARAV